MSIIATFATQSETDERWNPLEGDYYAQAFINKKFQAFDLELYNTKWFDYRFMTPFQATCAYIEAYGEVYLDIYKREIDAASAEFVKPITLEKVKNGLAEATTKSKRIFTACWRGRQFADAMGIPYDIYLELAFSFRMRHWNQNYMPQPEHLYNALDLEKIQARWEEMQGSRLWLSEHPAYMIQNYANTPIQNDYHEWLFKQAGLRNNVQETLARFVLEDHLLLDKVRARLTDAWEIERFEYYLDQS